MRKFEARKFLRGICANCQAGKLPGKSLCAECLRATSLRVKRLRTERKAAGLCIQCGRRRGRKGTGTYCKAHAARKAASMRRTVRKRLDWGKCRFGQPLKGVFRNCLRCRIAAGKGVARRKVEQAGKAA